MRRDGPRLITQLPETVQQAWPSADNRRDGSSPPELRVIPGGNNLRRRQLLRGLHGTPRMVMLATSALVLRVPFGLFCIPVA